MVHFVGAGPGAPDLITKRGARLLSQAEAVIYAGSLVSPAVLGWCADGCSVYDSSAMTLEQILEVMKEGRETVRLHTGDPSLYGAVREQMEALRRLGIPYDVTPGVSSFCAAAAALRTEYTAPGGSQTLIITRMAGRTSVPPTESVGALAAHGASMAIFLSAAFLAELSGELLKGAYTEKTPAAIVYKASWPEELVARCDVGSLAETGRRHGITRTALVLVGDFLSAAGARSCLYDPAFATGFREADA